MPTSDATENGSRRHIALPRGALSGWVVAAGLVYLIRRRPARLLALRFARGEIDGDEYRRSLAVLNEQRV